jgi:hypothetical protein
MDAHAMCYCDKSARLWYFLPTDPERRRWRGPYHTEDLMVSACTKELGEEVSIVRTIVVPRRLPAG